MVTVPSLGGLAEAHAAAHCRCTPAPAGTPTRFFPWGGGRGAFAEVGPHPLDHIAIDVARRGFPLLPDPLQEQQDLLAAFHPEFLGKLPYTTLLHPLPLRFVLFSIMRHSSRGGNPPPRAVSRNGACSSRPAPPSASSQPKG